MLLQRNLHSNDNFCSPSDSFVLIAYTPLTRNALKTRYKISQRQLKTLNPLSDFQYSNIRKHLHTAKQQILLMSLTITRFFFKKHEFKKHEPQNAKKLINI